MDKDKVIDDALRTELRASGAVDAAVDLLLPVTRASVTYDEGTRAVKGAKEAVAAAKAERPALFTTGKRYLDSSKSLEQLERESDAARRAKGVASWQS